MLKIIPFNQLQPEHSSGWKDSTLITTEASSLFKAKYQNKTVALKKFDDNSTEKRDHEAQIMGRLKHPHIIELIGTTTFEDNHPVLILELASKDLIDFLMSQPSLQQWTQSDDLFRMLAEMLQAIAYLHESDVLHRDLKPENILLDQNNQVKISDFGLAVTISDPTGVYEGPSCGTPHWMSPEAYVHFMSNRSVMSQYTDKTDMYGFGLLLWACFSISNPYIFLPSDPNELGKRITYGARNPDNVITNEPLRHLYRNLMKAPELRSNAKAALAVVQEARNKAASTYSAGKF